jgi:hypothetical protein
MVACAQQQDFSFIQNVQTGSGICTASYSMCTIILSLGYSDWGMVFSTYYHLMPRLRISGHMPLLQPHAFMVWEG